MSQQQISAVQLANDIEWVMSLNRGTNEGSLAREIADELLNKYSVVPKPAKPKSYADKPRGGGVW
jgi:hypothetical protein